MTEQEKIDAGMLFAPGDPALGAKKLKSHSLCKDYNRLYDNEAEARKHILNELLGAIGEGSSITAPMMFHYGCHTTIGKGTFINFGLTVQDDARVTIGNDCNLGPNVTIVTPVHPMLASERRFVYGPNGEKRHLCYAKPVVIGNDCWFGANVIVCPGVTIGDNCVIGAGSVVTKDIPANTFAAGNPCRVIRGITEEDSMKYKPEILGDNHVEEE